MARVYQVPGGIGVQETGTRVYQIPGGIGVQETQGGGASLNLSASAISLSGTAAVSGTLQFTVPKLNVAASALSVAGVVGVSGTLQYRVPFDLSASAVALSGTATVTGDIASSTTPKLDINANPLALSGALAASGDVQFTLAPTLNLSASPIALAGTVSAAGTLAYRVPFNLTAGSVSLGGAVAVAGDVQSATATGAAAIWSYVLSNGKTAEQTVVEIHSMLTDLHLVHGLTLGSPLSVSATRRLAGSVDQSVAESGGTVTVTRQ